jgi:threonine/homoserine/homoserine lactone efflux protein
VIEVFDPHRLRALAGVHVTFGILLLALALGLSVAAPHGLALRILRVTGGVLLLLLAFDGIRSAGPSQQKENRRRRLPPSLRGALAIVLNPGGWDEFRKYRQVIETLPVTS